MDLGSSTQTVMERVEQLLIQYGDDAACAAWLLCDRHDPKSIAFRIVHSDLSCETLTYGELKHESEKFAAVLRSLGVGRGDRVATLMGKSREYLVAVMSVWRLGAVHVPLFTAFAPAAITLRLTKSGAKVIICDHAQKKKLDSGEDIPINAEWTIITCDRNNTSHDTGVLNYSALMNQCTQVVPHAEVLGGNGALLQIYTSGTTGMPKGVVVPIRALAAFHSYIEFGLRLTDDDTYWCAADPGWAYGLYYGVLGSCVSGVTGILLAASYDPITTYRVLADYKVTHFAAAPTVYRSLMASGIKPPDNLVLRRATSAGEPLTSDVNEWSGKSLGVIVHDHYGQTEAGMLINNHHDPRVARPLKPGSMGVSLPGWRAVVLACENDALASVDEVGRLAFDLHASPLAWFKSYDGDPASSDDKFAGNGRWYLTGDLCYVDNDGYYVFSGREDDVIIMAGYRIGPLEVESVIQQHPGVRECAVVAVPDSVCGEVLEAFVALRDQTVPETVSEKRIQEWVKNRYAAHAYPRRVHFITELPRTPSGKLQRYKLREQRRR